MTRITFYSNLVDKHAQLRTLVQQALDKRHLVTVMAADAEHASMVSTALWHTPPSFLPNTLATHNLVLETPVIIDWQEKNLNQDDILINLTQQQFVCFSRFRHMIELVGVDDADKAAARLRFKFYRDRGYDIKHHDIQPIA